MYVFLRGRTRGLATGLGLVESGGLQMHREHDCLQI